MCTGVVRHAVTGPADDGGPEHPGAESTCPSSGLFDGQDGQSFSCRADEALKTRTYQIRDKRITLFDLYDL